MSVPETASGMVRSVEPQRPGSLALATGASHQQQQQSGLRDDASVFDTPDTQSRAGSSLESGTLETMASPFSLGSDAAAPRDVTLQHSRDVLLYTHRHGGGLAPYTPIIVVSQPPAGGSQRHRRLTPPQLQDADIGSDDVTGRESDGQEAQQQK